MDTYDHDHNLFANPGAGDEKLYVQFYDHYLLDSSASALEGRKIFKDTTFVKIFSPGDKNNIIDRPATEEDKQRFAQRYAKFKANEEQRSEGTPLAEWPIISRSMAEELKYMGFDTVEQIAGASDTSVSKYGMLTNLRSRAAAYIEVAKGSTAPIDKLVSEAEDQRLMIKQLQETVLHLQGTLHNLNIAAGKQVREAA